METQPKRYEGPPALPGTRPSGERMLDGAIDLLRLHGVRIEEPEALDLLRSADAILDVEEEMPRLRPQVVRRLLAGLPAAFNLYDRRGAKVATLAGGRVFGGRGALLATALPVPPPRDRAGVIRALGALSGSTLLGPLAGAPEQPAVLGAVADAYLALCLTPHPLLLRPRDPEALDALWNLLCVARGSADEARTCPQAILEIELERGMLLAAAAGRMLIEGARHGVPVALILPSPDSPGATPPARGAALATGLAAALIHQLARRQAPLLWGLAWPVSGEPRLPMAAEPSGATLDSRHDLLRAGEALEIPTVATSPARPDPPAAGREAIRSFAAATQAIAAGARLVVIDTSPHPSRCAWSAGGIGQLRALERLLGRPASRGAEATARRATPSRAAVPTGQLDADTAAALHQVVRRAAERDGVPAPPPVESGAAAPAEGG